MKKILVVIVLLALTVSLFAGCSNDSKFISQDEAQKIALNDLGIKADDAESIHVHVGQVAEGPCFSIHIDYAGTTYEYVILATNGQITSEGTVEEG